MAWIPPPDAIFKRTDNVTRLNASGNGTGQFQNTNSAMLLVIVQLSVITSPTKSGCTLVVSPPTGVVDTSYFAGTGDVAGDEPHFLLPGDFLNYTWSNGPANGQGIVTQFLYEVPL